LPALTSESSAHEAFLLLLSVLVTQQIESAMSKIDGRQLQIQFLGGSL